MMHSTFIVSLLAAASAAFAQADAVRKIIPGAYIFEFKDDLDTAEFYNKVKAEGTTRMTLDYKLFKGVSVQLHDLSNADQTAQRMSELGVVKNMWPISLIQSPNPKVQWVADDRTAAVKLTSRGAATTDTFSPHIMTQVDKLRADGITGAGIKLAVIDTGIDYEHPALGGCFGQGCLVSFGTDLVGNTYNGYNTPYPDPDPMDCGGHGTHVAGIIAAQQNQYDFTGAAPGVQLGAYKVFGCTGSAGTDVLIAAYNKAYEDGAQIITASIGGPSGWSEDPWAVTVSRIVDAGVPCTVAAGNEGAEGLFYASTAANGKRVTAVASVDNTFTTTILTLSSYTVDNGKAMKFGYAPGEPSSWDRVKMPLWADTLDITVPNDACNPFPANTPDLSEYIVLIRRGTCTFAEKAQNAAAKGAKYIIIYNNAPTGATSVDVSSIPNIVSIAMVEASVGEAWIRDLQLYKRIVLSMESSRTAERQMKTVDNKATGGALSTFTTWGPTWEMDVKPQFSAPGGNILSTYPRVLGSYAVLSGTSMATPLAAAIVALIAEVRGTTDPELIENLLAATANPQLFNNGAKFSDFLAPVAQQGAGLIQAYKAAHATTLLSHSSLSFNDTEHLVSVRNFTINNTGKKEITYRLSNVNTQTFYTFVESNVYPAAFPNENVNLHASLELSESKVTLGAGQAATIEVIPRPPLGLDRKRLPLWSGYIAINGTDGTALSIPYQGLVGSLNNHTVLAAEDSWISMSNDTKYTRAPDNANFTVPSPDRNNSSAVLPSLVINLALGSRLVIADLEPLTNSPPKSKKSFGISTMGQPAGFPALWSSRGVSPVPWNGQLNNGDYAPPGKYRLVVHALRIFGDESKKEDWDVSVTTSFNLKYT